VIAVIFEVVPSGDGRERYLELAAELAPHLAAVDGFISIERFVSLSDPNRLVSLSFWRDEDAVAVWRDLELHRAAQTAGRSGVFDAYRLRVASVLRDYGLMDREQAPADSRSRHG
jgi:heme-degrading monooxygenase HmoA